MKGSMCEMIIKFLRMSNQKLAPQSGQICSENHIIKNALLE